jgi:hypothetical protein
VNRSTWTFPKLGKDLIGPARQCLAFHAERLDFWRGQLDEATANLKAEGVTIEDLPEADAFGGTMSYRGDVSVKVDPTISLRIHKCQAKGRDHQESVREYERWVRAFEQNPDGSFDLDIDDLEHFRI